MQHLSSEKAKALHNELKRFEMEVGLITNEPLGGEAHMNGAPLPPPPPLPASNKSLQFLPRRVQQPTRQHIFHQPSQILIPQGSLLPPPPPPPPPQQPVLMAPQPSLYPSIFVSAPICPQPMPPPPPSQPAPSVYAAAPVKKTQKKAQAKEAAKLMAEPMVPIVDAATAATKRSRVVANMDLYKYVGPINPKHKKTKIIRSAGGQVWEDNSLLEWDPDDFRIFCGDLGKEVTDEVLAKAFSKYPSFSKAKVVVDKRNNQSKGYGFVSFKNSDDYVKAMREMNGRYVGSRPIKLRKSTWKERSIEEVKKKQKFKKKLGLA